MKHIKSIDQYSNKFEVLLDSIVEIMDQYHIIEYEEDDEWNPPNCTYYEYSYNKDGSIRQINISNINSNDYGGPLEILKALRNILPKLEKRTGFKIKIEYREDEDFIIILPNLPMN